MAFNFRRRLGKKHQSAMRKVRKSKGSGERVVRTEAGAKRYGVPIGTPYSAISSMKAGKTATSGAKKSTTKTSPKKAASAKSRTSAAKSPAPKKSTVKVTASKSKSGQPTFAAKIGGGGNPRKLTDAELKADADRNRKAGKGIHGDGSALGVGGPARMLSDSEVDKMFSDLKGASTAHLKRFVATAPEDDSGDMARVKAEIKRRSGTSKSVATKRTAPAKKAGKKTIDQRIAAMSDENVEYGLALSIKNRNQEGIRKFLAEFERRGLTVDNLPSKRK